MELTIGKNYKVATFGIVTTWHDCIFTEHRPKTATTNELYFFSGKLGIYPVLESELNQRVKEATK
jgi:hypothetical protein